MTPHAYLTMVVIGAGVAGAVWLLNKIGRALTAIIEALATLAGLALALWVVLRTVFRLVRMAVTHWRTTLGVLALSAWLVWWGWLSLAITVGAAVVCLAVWRWRHRSSFDPYAGRFLR